jgi:hypothetical protein
VVSVATVCHFFGTFVFAIKERCFYEAMDARAELEKMMRLLQDTMPLPMPLNKSN